MTIAEARASCGAAAAAVLDAERRGDYVTARQLSDALCERIGMFGDGCECLYRTAARGVTTPRLATAIVSWADWHGVYLEARALANHMVDVRRTKDGGIVVQMDDGRSAFYDSRWVAYNAKVDPPYYVCAEHRLRARAIKYALRHTPR